MDATRPRRTQDSVRQRWYALFRTVRFARYLRFPPPPPPEPKDRANNSARER
jgi:hypothetical protein